MFAALPPSTWLSFNLACLAPSALPLELKMAEVHSARPLCAFDASRVRVVVHRGRERHKCSEHARFRHRVRCVKLERRRVRRHACVRKAAYVVHTAVWGNARGVTSHVRKRKP